MVSGEVPVAHAAMLLGNPLLAPKVPDETVPADGPVTNQ
jgi:hypothetical protein